ncbi:unnamed protein product, partial [Angiostrongylus costaricensis]|uniref:Ovule protein n=1 Tax=Angiostrongylus costaricensis TaxID=334426 RepID=A0A0R3PPF2_ANGCS
MTGIHNEHYDEEKNMVPNLLGPKVRDVMRPVLLSEKLQHTNNPMKTKPDSILGRLTDHQLVVAQNEQPNELQETYKYEDENSDELHTTQMSVSELIDIFEGTVKIRPSKYEGRKSLNVWIRYEEHMQPHDPDHHHGNRKFHDGSIVHNEDVQLRHIQDYNENHETENLSIHCSEDVQRSVAVKDTAAVIDSHKLPTNPRKQPPRTSPWFNPNSVSKRALTRSVLSHVPSFTKKNGLESTEN